MRIDLSRRSVFCVNTLGLGELAVFASTYGQTKLLNKAFGHNIGSADVSEFIRQLILVSSCPVHLLVDGVKPTRFRYQDDACSKLTDDDVERYSELYASHVVDLVCICDVVRKGENKDDEKRKVLDELTKRQDEGCSKYVHRVKIYEHDQIKKAMFSAMRGVDLATIAPLGDLKTRQPISMLAENIINSKRYLDGLGASLPSSMTKLMNMHDVLSDSFRCSAIADHARNLTRIIESMPQMPAVAGAFAGIDLDHFAIRNSAQKSAEALGLATSSQLGFVSSLPECVSETMARLSQLGKSVGEYGAGRFVMPSASFKMPIATELSCLGQQMDLYAASSVFRDYMPTSAAMAGLVASIKEPWLSVADPTKSIHGLVDLTAIGQCLAVQEPFASELTDTLRRSFGDWRGFVTPAAECFDDPVSRLAYYEGKGLNSALTYFPDDSYDHILDEVGVTSPVALFKEHQRRRRIGSEAVDSVHGFDLELGAEVTSRNDAAMIIMRKFETRLREFIVSKMVAQFGEKWVKQRVSGETRKKWEGRMSEAAKSDVGCECHLIHFSDLGDLCDIIVQKGNWDAVFRDCFYRKESVMESFARISPVRRCLAHFRELKNDDVLLFRVEVVRVLRSLKR